MLGRHEQRQARKRATAVAKALFSSVSMPDPVTVETVCATLAAHRGRAIRLIPMSTLDIDQPPFSGVWLAGRETDYVFFDDAWPRLAVRNAILHELGHILLDHRSNGRLTDLMVIMMKQVIPAASPAALRSTVQAGLCRTNGVAAAEIDTDPVHELEAELLAAELGTKWSDPARRPTAARTGAQDDTVLRRVAGAMDYGLGLPADRTL
ncbi:hypothetical protein [Amycolatopsis sp. VC5-11]|uniref:hypothetical protein n=1 Tax=Amycolatopsis sp. VC5-11 TaxID=3120156 RepID=UPI00300A34B9